MKKGFVKSLKIVTTLLALMFFALDLQAQIYFGITPIRFELKVAAAGQKTEVIYVRNNSSKPIRLKVYAENWTLTADGTPNFMGNQPTSFSCREWIKVNPSDFRLQPEEIKSVRFTISVPEDIEPGGYHAAISFEQVPETPAGARLGQVAFVGKIVAAVYVLVGKVPVEGSLEDLVLEARGESQLLRLKLSNSGRTHFRLKGEVLIKTAEGKKAGILEIPDEPVLPQSQRWLTIQLNERLPPGKYRAEVRLDIGREELLAFEKEIIVN